MPLELDPERTEIVAHMTEHALRAGHRIRFEEGAEMLPLKVACAGWRHHREVGDPQWRNEQLRRAGMQLRHEIRAHGMFA